MMKIVFWLKVHKIQGGDIWLHQNKHDCKTPTLANFSHTAFTRKEEGLKKFFDVSFHMLLNAYMFLQALLTLN